MNITEIKERYDYDNPDGDFFYEAVYGNSDRWAKDFGWLIAEIERLMMRSNRWMKAAEESVEETKKYKGRCKNAITIAEKAEAEVARLQNERKHILASRAAQSDRTTKAETEVEFKNGFNQKIVNALERESRYRGLAQLEVKKLEAEVKRLRGYGSTIHAELEYAQQRADRVEANKAKLTDFINEVKNSADRAYLREKAERLIMELEEE